MKDSSRNLLRTAFPIVLLFSLAHGHLAAQPENWQSVGIGGGGALFACSISPYHSDELFIACDMSELFHSTDFGSSWSTYDFHQINGGNRTGHIRFTDDPNVMYTISVRGDYTVPVRTTDGGKTWNALPGDPTDNEAYSLYTDPAKNRRLLVTDYNRLYLSQDGGASFEEKYADESGNGFYIAGAFFDGETIYLGTNFGIFRSGDGGTSFALDESFDGIPDDEIMVSFTGAKENGTIRFYCVTLGNGDVFPGVTGADHDTYHNVYKAQVGGSGWSSIAGGIPSGIHPFFIDMAQGNINTLYVAGGSDDGAPTVFKTTDAGEHWVNVFRTENNQNIATGWSGDGGDREWSFGEYALGFAVCRNDPDRAVITDLGFAHATKDGGASWSQIYVDPESENDPDTRIQQGKSYRGVGLENTAVWHLAWANEQTMIASFTDIRGVRSADGGNSWHHVYDDQNFNTAYYALKHPTTGTIYAATSSIHDLYQSTYLSDARIDNGRGGVLFSTDNGAAWETLHDFGHPVIWLAADPANPNRLYASVVHSTDGGIYVTDNLQAGAGSTWRKLSSPARTEGHPFNIQVLSDGSLLCTYSGRRTASFTASSGIFLSTDGGATWSDRSSEDMRYWTKDVVVDPSDPAQKTWYVGVWSGYGGNGEANNRGGLYKTTDRGQTWGTTLQLPSRDDNTDRVTSCAINPDNPEEMYVTTETDGLWYTSNLNAKNPTFRQVEAYPFRQPERVFFNPFNPNEVWVTSFGNGIRVGRRVATGVEEENSSLPRILNLY